MGGLEITLEGLTASLLVERRAVAVVTHYSYRAWCTPIGRGGGATAERMLLPVLNRQIGTGPSN